MKVLKFTSLVDALQAHLNLARYKEMGVQTTMVDARTLNVQCGKLLLDVVLEGARFRGTVEEEK